MSHGACYGRRENLIGMDPFDHEKIWVHMYGKRKY
jgi:L-rhamnonate dehydratase